MVLEWEVIPIYGRIGGTICGHSFTKCKELFKRHVIWSRMDRFSLSLVCRHCWNFYFPRIGMRLAPNFANNSLSKIRCLRLVFASVPFDAPAHEAHRPEWGHETRAPTSQSHKSQILEISTGPKGEIMTTNDCLDSPALISV
jgi:hypothetical protein